MIENKEKLKDKLKEFKLKPKFICLEDNRKDLVLSNAKDVYFIIDDKEAFRKEDKLITYLKKKDLKYKNFIKDKPDMALF